MQMLRTGFAAAAAATALPSSASAAFIGFEEFGNGGIACAGLGWDNVSFKTSTTPVPEPGSIGMLVAGLGTLVVARRQRRG